MFGGLRKQSAFSRMRLGLCVLLCFSLALVGTPAYAAESNSNTNADSSGGVLVDSSDVNNADSGDDGASADGGDTASSTAVDNTSDDATASDNTGTDVRSDTADAGDKSGTDTGNTTADARDDANAGVQGYDEEGKTFTKEGITYTITGFGDWAPECEITSVDSELLSDPDRIAITSLEVSPDKTSGLRFGSYRITGIAKGAFAGFTGSVMFSLGELSLVDFLEDSGLLSKNIDLLIDDDCFINSHSKVTWFISYDNQKAYELSQGYAFDFYMDDASGYYGIENDSDSSITLNSLTTSCTIDLAAGDTLQAQELQPKLSGDDIEYSTDGGKTWEQGEVFLGDDGDENSLVVELAKGTPDGPVLLRLVMPGIEKGYITSDWKDNTCEVTLNHHSSDTFSLGLTSLFLDTSSTTTLRVTAEPGENAVYIGGVLHEEPFSEDGVTLAYDNEGHPVLTLNGASITGTGGPEYYSSGAAVYAMGDITIKLEGEDSNILVDKPKYSTHGIYARGNVSIIDNTTGDTQPQLTITLAYGNDRPNPLPAVIMAGSVDITNAKVTLRGGYDAGCSSGLSSLDFMRVGGDITLSGERCEVSLESLDTAEGSLGLYGMEAGAITIQDSTVAMKGEFVRAIRAKSSIAIAGCAKVDLVCEPRCSPAAISVFADETAGTLSVDLAKDGYFKLKSSDDVDLPYGILVGSVTLGSKTVLAEPKGARFATVDFPLGSSIWASYPETSQTVVNESGEVVGAFTFKAADPQIVPAIPLTPAVPINGDMGSGDPADDGADDDSGKATPQTGDSALLGPLVVCAGVALIALGLSRVRSRS